ncbi:MAG: radical SAM family heme chaperone HemW [Gammaproteobacteria bacterium]|jgi:oxygen-independent coproporphyrinogen-3 oxidase|nr:radical SAM family heme chaperone HemW [Gammaproteobacteria bacterium]
MSTDIPLALYVHLPWCIRKCPYCDFNSRALKGDLPAQAYTQSLIVDLRHTLAELDGRPVETVFFGGGTPSLFPATQIARLLKVLREEYPLSPAAEITLEANPGTREGIDFAALLEAGVNRLSVGAQTFDPDMLTRLGRIHSVDDIPLTVERAREAGFDNINLDIMHGLPGQQLSMALEDLHSALALEPRHLSWYQLTIEPNTVFWANPPELPEEEILCDIHDQGRALLESAGFTQYEVSAWARKGDECLHNLNYWRFGDYLGIGAGAHEKLTLGGEIFRRARWSNPERYQQQVGKGLRWAESRQPCGEELVFEFMLNALRLRAGFSLDMFAIRTGLAPATILPRLQDAAQRGLMEEWGGDGWRPTDFGLRFLNDLQLLFLNEAARA